MTAPHRHYYIVPLRSFQTYSTFLQSRLYLSNLLLALRSRIKTFNLTMIPVINRDILPSHRTSEPFCLGEWHRELCLERVCSTYPLGRGESTAKRVAFQNCRNRHSQRVRPQSTDSLAPRLCCLTFPLRLTEVSEELVSPQRMMMNSAMMGHNDIHW